jgi:hypothetical protein
MFGLQRINERCLFRQGGLRKHCLIALQILVKLASASEWSVNQEESKAKGCMAIRTDLTVGALVALNTAGD